MNPVLFVRSLAGVAGLTLGLVVAACAQSSTPVGPNCQVGLELATQIDDIDRGPGQFTPWVAADSRRIYFVEAFDEASIRVFDASTGEFVRVVGHEGEGPGEFRRISGIRAVADSLYVLDRGNVRLSVLGPDLEVVRDFRVPVRPIDFQPLTLLNGVGLAVNGWAHTAELAGEPIHLFGPDGTRLRSFGADQRNPYRNPNSLNGFRHGAARGGEFWTVRLNSYLLEQWDPRTGRRLGTVAIEDGWPREAYRDGQAIQAIPPLIFGLHLDDEGRAWVVGRKSVGEPQPRSREHGQDQRDLAEVVVLRVDVLDLVAGEVIASTTLPDYGGGFLETGQLFSFRSMESPGQMSVWDLSLSCTAPRSTPSRR